MSVTKVKLRKRLLPSGKITLYLDFWPPLVNPNTGKASRREYLGIYLVNKPRTPEDREANNVKMIALVFALARAGYTWERLVSLTGTRPKRISCSTSMSIWRATTRSGLEYMTTSRNTAMDIV